MDKGYPVILMGDMNDTWKDNERGGSHGRLREWADTNGWSNQICELCDSHDVELIAYSDVFCNVSVYFPDASRNKAQFRYILSGSHLLTMQTLSAGTHMFNLLVMRSVPED